MLEGIFREGLYSKPPGMGRIRLRKIRVISHSSRKMSHNRDMPVRIASVAVLLDVRAPRSVELCNRDEGSVDDAVNTDVEILAAGC